MTAVSLGVALTVLWHFVIIGYPQTEHTKFDSTLAGLAGEFYAARKRGDLGPGLPVLWLQERLESRSYLIASAPQMVHLFRRFPESMGRAMLDADTDQMSADLQTWTPEQREFYASFHDRWATAQRRFLRFGHVLGLPAYPRLVSEIRRVSELRATSGAKSEDDLLFSAAAVMIGLSDIDFGSGFDDVERIPALHR